jgi:hypothetical protein
MQTSRALWRRWVLVTTAGELAGFCVPASAGAVTSVGHVDGLGLAAFLAIAMPLWRPRPTRRADRRHRRTRRSGHGSRRRRSHGRAVLRLRYR